MINNSSFSLFSPKWLSTVEGNVGISHFSSCSVMAVDNTSSDLLRLTVQRFTWNMLRLVKGWFGD